MYKNKSELLALLAQEGLRAQKQLGQNFLINYHIIEKIVEAADIQPQLREYIVEIGPGLGVLTQALLEANCHVHAIELDRELAKILQKKWGGDENFELEIGTALKATLPNKPYKIVANIPYYITSPLLRHFLWDTAVENKKKKMSNIRPQSIVLLVQHEVAQKICAQDGEHSILSLQTQIFGEPRIVHKVGPQNFYPAPKVDSAILHIEVHEEPLIKNLKLFSQLIRVSFHQRRKMLANTLRQFLKLDREAITSIFKKAEIPEDARPQVLSIKQWDMIVESVERLKP